MRVSVWTLVVLGVLAIMTSSLADIPQMITFQGKVTDTGGSPVSDGTYNMQFEIYDAVSGCTSLWNSGSVSVQVTDGIFSVLLGGSPQPALSLDFSQDYWMEVTVESDGQTPRQQLGSVGYAYMASGLVPGTEVSGSVTTGTEAAFKAVNTATSPGFVDGGVFESYGPQGRGVYGIAYSTVGTNYGVVGRSGSTAGRGVYGNAWSTTGTTYGVRGSTYSPDGCGVYGHGSADSGNSYGVYGKTDSPSGFAGYFEGVVHASSATSTGNAATILGLNTSSADYTCGIKGETSSTTGYGVLGRGDATSGSPSGVYGGSSTPSGIGVRGWANDTSGTNYGVHGMTSSPSGYGVYGTSPGGYGVYGINTATTGTNNGVYGQSNSSSGYGVYGTSPGGGVYGYSSSDYGVYGEAPSHGVYGPRHCRQWFHLRGLWELRVNGRQGCLWICVGLHGHHPRCRGHQLLHIR